MSVRLNIPREVMILNPTFSAAEIRTVLNTILNAKSARLRQSNIFRVHLPHIGVMRSNANKKPKSIGKMRTRDRKKKRMKQRNKTLTKEYILW